MRLFQYINRSYAQCKQLRWCSQSSTVLTGRVDRYKGVHINLDSSEHASHLLNADTFSNSLKGN